MGLQIFMNYGLRTLVGCMYVHLVFQTQASRLQAIALFEAYRFGTSILGMIQTAVGHHNKFEFVL